VANPPASSSNTTATSYSGPCPQGHACPLNSTGQPAKVACSSNEYQDEEGQGSCKSCPAGHYCNSTASFRCRPGDTGDGNSESFYCPAGSSSKVQCPSGTYNFIDGSSIEEDCVPCPPGSYCPSTSSAAKIIPCPAGSYCVGGGSAAATCPIGFYCPQQSSTPVPCDPGSHCNAAGLSQPSGSCSAGSYCTHEAVSNSSAYDFCSAAL